MPDSFMMPDKVGREFYALLQVDSTMVFAPYRGDLR